MNTQFWQNRLDNFKHLGADTDDPQLKVVYGRYEMIMRVEVELAEAEEKVAARRGKV